MGSVGAKWTSGAWSLNKMKAPMTRKKVQENKVFKGKVHCTNEDHVVKTNTKQKGCCMDKK